jgi:hypothetical protein
MMKRLIVALLAAGAFAAPAFAASVTPLSAEAVASHQSALTAQQAALAHLKSQGRKDQAATVYTPAVVGTQLYPGTPMRNAFRAYPPSCAADPLPTGWPGATTTYSTHMPFYAIQNNSTGVLENVTVTIWRVPCSSSGDPAPYNPQGFDNAMTLMRVDRANDSDTSTVPFLPFIQVSQGDIGFTTGTGAFNPESLPRIAMEPNTVISDVVYNSAIPVSTTYVLENYPYSGSGYFTYSDGFTIRFNPNVSGVSPVDIVVPPYQPASVPQANATLPFDGYAAAQWYNSDFNEGLLLQVSEQPQADGSTVRQLVFDLLTKDDNGDPLWLVGDAAFDVGQRVVTIDTIYLGPDLAHLPWGQATFTFPDCNHLDVNFAPDANLPAPIPSFSGVTTYDRLFTANGMTCE